MRGERWLVGALLAVLVLQLAYGLLTDGATADELTYVGAGFRHLHGDFTIDPDHPPLAKLIGAAPLLLLAPTMTAARPDDDQDGWAYRFFHEDNRARPLLRAARTSAVVLTVLLALLVYAWARQATTAAAMALCAVTFQPGFLAHGHLATTDMACALLMVLASWAYWRFEQSPGILRAGIVAAAVGAAALARLTSLVLVPAIALLVIVHLVSGEDRRRWARAVATLVLAHLVIVPALVWMVYGFRHGAAPDGTAFGTGPWPRGFVGRTLEFSSAHHLFPEAFIEGVRFQALHEAGGHPTYLLGERSKEGWPYYYLVVLLVKNTPGFLLFLGAAVSAVVLRRTRPARVWLHWLVPAAVILAAASLARVQLGERYILPVYAYLILWAASATGDLLRAARGRLVLIGAGLLHALPVIVVASGGYLTYFNFIAGGGEGGSRWLADSNLDWGQDLPRLSRWMRDRGVARIELGYFGADDPDRYGIPHEDLPTWHGHHPVHAPAMPFQGTVVVSPNLALGYLYPPGRNPYERLRNRKPDARAGVFFVYDFGGKTVENPAEKPVD